MGATDKSTGRGAQTADAGNYLGPAPASEPSEIAERAHKRSRGTTRERPVGRSGTGLTVSMHTATKPKLVGRMRSRASIKIISPVESTDWCDADLASTR